jgi:hypothetical protein
MYTSVYIRIGNIVNELQNRALVRSFMHLSYLSIISIIYALYAPPL